jgi:hypothetical protein
MHTKVRTSLALYLMANQFTDSLSHDVTYRFPMFNTHFCSWIIYQSQIVRRFIDLTQQLRQARTRLNANGGVEGVIIAVSSTKRERRVEILYFICGVTAQTSRVLYLGNNEHR